MSKGKWELHPLTRLPSSVELRGVDLRKQYTDCDLFCVNSIAAAAGYKTPSHLEAKIATNPELFHAYPIKDARGVTVTLATATNSAQAGGVNLRAKAAEAHRAAASLSRKPKTDPSSGTLS